MPLSPSHEPNGRVPSPRASPRKLKLDTCAPKPPSPRQTRQVRLPDRRRAWAAGAARPAEQPAEPLAVPPPPPVRLPEESDGSEIASERSSVVASVDASPIPPASRGIEPDTCPPRAALEPRVEVRQGSRWDGIGMDALDLWTAADVACWLRSIGLGQFTASFVDGKVDGPALRLVTRDELHALGVTTVGHRLQILHGVGQLLRTEPGAGCALGADGGVALAAVAASIAEAGEGSPRY
jgi:hypothetical protein